MKVALAQIAPVLLDRTATLEKVVTRIHEAADAGATLVCFGESLVPGYPVWLSRGDGARFDADDQKDLHARYLREAVCLEAGDLDVVTDAARARGIVVVLGIIERPRDRGGHTVYCSRVIIDATGAVGSVHRKLMPTYEERLAWGAGDGAGLVTHPVGPFRLGALNCWENWLPLARTALQADGEDLHVALWPGGEHNTRDITRFIALEGRSYVLSVCGLLRESDIPADVPHRDRWAGAADEMILNGGTAAAAPDGTWLLEPVVGAETLRTLDLDPAEVARARQNLDNVGHYARPDVFELTVNRRRQSIVTWDDP